MAFNARVKQYGNGSVQVRFYSKPIITKEDYSQSETELEYLKKQYQDKKMDEYLKSYTLDPFTQNWVHFLEEPKEEEEKERCSRSQKRSKQKIYEHTRSCHWQWFITLTLNPRKVDSLDYDKSSYAVREWMHYLKKHYAPDLKYILVPEQHKDSKRWHFHGLLADCGKLTFRYAKDIKGKPIYNITDYSKGWSTASPVEDTKKVSSYITKYITKELGLLIPGKQCYFVSKNLPKCDEFILQLNRKEDDLMGIVESFANSLGKEITHISSSGNDYTKCTYFELGDVAK